ncbi:hypothetical protein, partial [Frankia sp. AgB1.8]
MATPDPTHPTPTRRRRARPGRRLLAALAFAVAALLALTLWAASPATAATPATATTPPPTGALAPPVSAPVTPPSTPGLDPAYPTVPAPASTPPAASPTPADTDSGSGGGGGGGLFGWLSGATDLPGMVSKAINTWLAGMARDAAQPVLRLLGQTLLSTPDVTTEPQVRQLWAASLIIADSLFLLVLTVGAVGVMGEGTVHGRAMAREFAPRMTIALATAHLSLPLMGQAITLSNALERAILGGQVTADGAANLLATTLLVGRGVPVYLLLLGLGVLGMAIALIAAWIIRMILMMVLAVAAPLLLIWHGLPWTEALAALWWRALGGCLAIQTGQALLLLVGVRVLLSDHGRPDWLPPAGGLVNTLTAGALFFLAIRLQGWVSQLVLRATGGSSRSALRTLVQYRLLRQATRLIGSSAGPAGAALAAGGRRPTGRRPPGPGRPGTGGAGRRPPGPGRPGAGA